MYLMSRVRAKDTKPELVVRSFLHRNGFRFRLHVKSPPGTPDIVLPKYKTVIDIRGCFWHRHPGCRKTTTPSTHVDFWQKKFTDNISRDQRIEAELQRLGWHVIVIWECEVINGSFRQRIENDLPMPKKLEEKKSTKAAKIKKIAVNTYLITPYTVAFMGDLIDELENNGLYF